MFWALSNSREFENTDAVSYISGYGIERMIDRSVREREREKLRKAGHY